MNKVLQAAKIATKRMIPAFVGMGLAIFVTLVVANPNIWSWIFWIGALVFMFLLVWYIAYKNLE